MSQRRLMRPLKYVNSADPKANPGHSAVPPVRCHRVGAPQDRQHLKGLLPKSRPVTGPQGSQRVER